MMGDSGVEAEETCWRCEGRRTRVGGMFWDTSKGRSASAKYEESSKRRLAS